MTRACLSLSIFVVMACEGSSSGDSAGALRHDSGEPLPPVDAGVDAGEVPEIPRDAGPNPTPAQLTLSGVVHEATPGARPIDGAAVNAWVQEPKFGYSYWWAHGPLFSDPEGRFRLTDLPESSIVRLQVGKPGYFQQCASPPVTMDEDVQLDAELVPFAAVSAAPESFPPPAPGFRLISGRVLLPGARPFPWALVDFEPIMDFPAAMTFSDADGFYLLCNLPEGDTVDLCAGVPGNVACVAVPPGLSAGVDIVLPGDAGP